MSTDLPAALANEAAGIEAEARSARGVRGETALAAVLFAAAAVLFVSFFAVVTGLA